MLKQKIIVVLILFISSLLWGNQLDSKRTYTIAFAQGTLDNDFRFAQVKGVQQALSQYPNIRFIYSDAKSNSALQVKQIEDFIHQGVDLLMTSPHDEVAATEVIAKAYRSGIPVVMVGRTVKGSEYTTYVHSDIKQVARDAAGYLAEQIGYKGRVLLLKGVPTADTTRKHTEGFYEVISEYPQIEVIERTGNCLRRDAIIEAERLSHELESYDAVMSQSDSMLIGVRMVMEAYGIDPASLVTVGIGYIKAAQEAIRSGQQTSSFVHFLSARESAEAAVKILTGEKVPKEITMDTLQVTKENVDAVEPIF